MANIRDGIKTQIIRMGTIALSRGNHMVDQKDKGISIYLPDRAD
jgi:hypothetical protein